MKTNYVQLDLGGGTLYQIANRSPIQMMSYFIKTEDGKIVIIDGGNYCDEDGKYLYDQIKKNGGKVDLWLITHAHDDHFGALLWIMEKGFEIEINKIYYSFPPLNWFETIENGTSYEAVKRFIENTEKYSLNRHEYTANEVISCSNISFEILNDCKDYIKYSSINDTSIIIRAHFPRNDILFLGDLGPECARDRMKSIPHKKLNCPIVQMAHHGQGGAEKAFYEIVNPQYCLYTAPEWLWENDAGKGHNTGPFKTLITRKWMEELNVKASYPHAFGDYIFY